MIETAPDWAACPSVSPRRGSLIVRVQSLTLAAAGAALLAPTTLSGAGPGCARAEPVVAGARATSAAADLLAKVRDCTPVSRGRYRSDDGKPRDHPGLRHPGRRLLEGRHGHRLRRPARPAAATAAPTRSSPTPPPTSSPTAAIWTPNASRTSSCPPPSRIWNHRDYGVRGGSVAAVVYRDRVQYAVVGDIGPQRHHRRGVLRHRQGPRHPPRPARRRHAPRASPTSSSRTRR